MAVALSESDVAAYIADLDGKDGELTIACSNSPSSITVSGDKAAVLSLQRKLESDGVFARLLKVDIAYHSYHMDLIAQDYRIAIDHIQTENSDENIEFYSSVTGSRLNHSELQASYWVRNLQSKVRFSDAIRDMCLPALTSQDESTMHLLIEIGPHSALAGPIRQTVKKSNITYLPSLIRDEDGQNAMFNLICKLIAAGVPLDLNSVNQHDPTTIRQPLVDLPPYQWDHSVQYWSESRMSREYRNRPHPRHELLGSRSIDHDPDEPKWRNHLMLSEIPWLKGHVIQSEVVFPAAGYIGMAMEAVRQRLLDLWGQATEQYSIHFRDIKIDKALMIKEGSDDIETIFTLRHRRGVPKTPCTIWCDFRVRSYDQNRGWLSHCSGNVAVQFNESSELGPVLSNAPEASELQQQLLQARKHCHHFRSQQDIYARLARYGVQYRESFSALAECSLGDKQVLAIVQAAASASKETPNPHDRYLLHPTALDGCFQALLVMITASDDCTGSPCLTFIERLDISCPSVSKVEPELLVYAQCPISLPRGAIGELIVTENRAQGQQRTLLSASGLQLTTIPFEEIEHQNQMRNNCYSAEWIPDIELFDPSRVSEICHQKLEIVGSDREETLAIYSRASLYYVHRALRLLGPGSCLPKGQIHLQHLLNWMETFVAEDAASGQPLIDSWTESETEDLLRYARDAGKEGVMLSRMGENLPAILEGKAQPLPLLLKDNLLQSFYSNESLNRCYTQLSTYVSLLATKKPQMKILEIGAGTGGTTMPVLKALTSEGPEQRFLFDTYDFTDISSGFFEKAQTLLEPWSGVINFGKLDIERLPSSQGFSKGVYDLVIASNVLHATMSIDNTLRNSRELLKPGGKIILLEITKLQPHLNVSFGTLPGWWAGK